jgi:hypothetical protein
MLAAKLHRLAAIKALPPKKKTSGKRRCLKRSYSLHSDVFFPLKPRTTVRDSAVPHRFISLQASAQFDPRCPLGDGLKQLPQYIAIKQSRVRELARAIPARFLDGALRCAQALEATSVQCFVNTPRLYRMILWKIKRFIL